jgi:iron complex transport system ATP-binding protein
MTYQLDGVTIAHDGNVVLRDIHLTVPCGRLTGVIGPNGAGKSTLLAAMAGDLSGQASAQLSSQGRVLLWDKPIESAKPGTLARQRAIMSQQAAAVFNLTVRDVLWLGLYAFDHWSDLARDDLLSATAKATGVQDWLDQTLTSRSLGQQQRVHFTRALLQAQASWLDAGQAWLLLDEPTASQDPWHQHAMMSVCRAFLARGSVGIVVVMHDLTLAAQWCDDMIIIKNGAVLAQGATRSVLDTDRIKQTFGSGLEVQVLWEPAPGVIISHPNPGTAAPET